MGTDGNKVQFSIRVPPIIHAALQSEAKETFTSINSIVCQILADHYEEQLEKWRAQVASEETISMATV